VRRGSWGSVHPGARHRIRGAGWRGWVGSALALVGGDEMARSKNKQKVKRHQHAMRRKRRLKRKKLAAQSDD